MSRLVLFDIDGTLLPGRSSEARFIAYLLRRGWLGPRQLLSALGFLLRYVGLYGRDVTKKNKSYLAGLPVDRVEQAARRFVERRLLPQLFAPTVSRLEEHLSQGDHVVLLSGTPEFIARPLAAALGAHGYHSSICATRKGRFAAARPLQHPYGVEKLNIARKIAADVRMPLSEAVAYGDSYSDAILFRAVGRSVAVMPDRRLREAAAGEGWEILPLA
jgi:HAD superfamily hydrolase (TIGR01490 family)